MQRCIGVRREDKSQWERRVPVVPAVARELIKRHGIRVYVQPSPNRTFTAEEFWLAGAHVQEDLCDCPVIFGVKEIPVNQLQPGKTYVFFAHVIKGQPYNMPMLRRILDLGCTLIDYERIVDDQGRRLIFFGRHAGLAGALETLWTLGQRLAGAGIDTPFAELRHAHEYRDLDEARDAVSRAGDAIRRGGLPPQVSPLTIGVTGYGNVARGAWEILDLLPVVKVAPTELSALRSDGAEHNSVIYAITFREEHTVTLAETYNLPTFNLQHYYAQPHEYRSVFESYLPHLDVIINAVYWDARYPRLVTKDALRRHAGEGALRLKVIGDISCDIEGAMECTVRATEPGEPVFTYNPLTGDAADGYAGPGVAVMAVDILPSELPRDASADFSKVLSAYIPEIAEADYEVPYEALDLPPEIKAAVIAHRGELTPEYAYIKAYLSS
jgi:saccharopine dehydrogenase (NAD+, L-lysine forming)